MEIVIIIFSFVYLNVLAGAQQDGDVSADAKALTCGPNEIVVNCPSDCPTDLCAKTANESKACAVNKQCPPPSCKCRFNYKRLNASCIPALKCPSFPCPENERFDPCPPLCPSDGCSSKNLNGICPFRIGIVLPCNAKCRCEPGYFRDDSGKCIPADQCPLICPLGQVEDDCPTDCPSDYCPKSTDDDQSSCPKPEPCPKPTCKCGVNQRKAENGTCIPTTKCPSFPCPCNEVFDPCPAYCPTDSCESRYLNGTCLYEIKTLLICKPACRCADGYFRTNGVCVPAEKCPCDG